MKVEKWKHYWEQKREGVWDILFCFDIHWFFRKTIQFWLLFMTKYLHNEFQYLSICIAIIYKVHHVAYFPQMRQMTKIKIC